MFRIIYVSVETSRFTRQGLEELLEQSREKNTRVGITGLLIYKGGSFMQVLEGEEDKVKAVFESIRNDPRHQRVVAVVQEPIEARDFPEWSMAFREIDPTRDEIPPAFSDLLHRPWSELDLEIHPDMIRSFIRVFMAATGG